MSGFSKWVTGIIWCFQLYGWFLYLLPDEQVSKGPWIRRSGIRLTEELFMQQNAGSDGTHRYMYRWNLPEVKNGWNFDPRKRFGKITAPGTGEGALLSFISWCSMRFGTLGVCPVESVANAFHHSEKTEIRGLSGNWEHRADGTLCSSEDGFCRTWKRDSGTVLYQKQNFVMRGTPTRFGLALQVDEALIWLLSDV